MRRRKKKIHGYKLTMTILIPSRNNGMAGDLLGYNCHCYIGNTYDQEMMGPGGHSPQSLTFHYGRTTDWHIRRIMNECICSTS
jgi:hypothetical protein